MKRRILAAIMLGVMMFTFSPMVLAQSTQTEVLAGPDKGNNFASVDVQDYNKNESTVTVTDSANSADMKSAVVSADAGEVLVFDSVELTDAKVLMLVASVPSGSTGKTIDIYIDSDTDANKIGTLALNSTAKVNNLDFNEQYTTLVSGISGKHKVIFKFLSATEFEMDWFKVTTYTGAETDAERDARMDWWRDARYGQFIHIGAYSYLGGYYQGKKTPSYSEWIMDNLHISKEDYKNNASIPFNPIKFDAEKIVSDAKAAGQKYLVVTSRHHEGLSVYDTQIRNFKDYSIFSVSNYGEYQGVDIVKALSEECEKQGIVFGVYTTIMDWYDPSQLGYNMAGLTEGYTKEEYKAQLKGQLKELIEDYGAKIFFFDGHWVDWWTTEDGQETYRFIRSLDESCIVNNRVGKRARTDGDYDTPEQTIPVTGLDYDWESCVTMNNSWGYSKDDNNWKSAQWIVENVIDIASKGGNLLLNVGPDGDGVVQQEPIDRMTEAGQWFEKFGDAVFNTRVGCFSTQIASNIRVTTNPEKSKIYVNLLNANPTAIGSITLPKLENEIISVKEMASGEDVPYTMVMGKLNMNIASTEQQKFATVYEITVDGTPTEASVADTNLALNKAVEVSSYWNNNANYGPAKLTDGNTTSTRWAPWDGKDSNPWAIIDLGETTTFGRVQLYEWRTNSTTAYRCNGFKISVSNDKENWTEVYTGTSIGAKAVVKFPEQLNARYIKVHDISTNTTAGNATLWEIEVYEVGADPQISITADKEYVNFPYTVTGTYQDGASVELTLFGASFSPVTVNAVVNKANNTWSAVIDNETVKTGLVTIQATLKNSSGVAVAIAPSSFEYIEKTNIAYGKDTEFSTAFVRGNGDVLGSSLLVDGYLTGAFRRWAPLDNDPDPWAIIDLGGKQTFDEIEVFEWLDNNSIYRCKSFKISVSDDKSQWTEIHTGTTIGERVNIKFDDAVHTRYVKIHDLESSVTTTESNVSLYELAVLAPEEVPSVTITSDKEYMHFPYTVEGAYAYGATVEVTLSGDGFEPVTLDAAVNEQDGTWSAVLDDDSVKAGDVTVTVTLKDADNVELTTATTVFEYTGKTNIAYGKAAEHSTAFTRYNGDVLGATLMLDGYVTGNFRRWAPLDNDPDPWAIIDLGKKQYFNEFEIFEWLDNNGVYRCKSFKISVSDDKSQWTEIYTGTTIGERVNIKLDKTANARYIKIHDLESSVTATESNVTIHEIAVYAPEIITGAAGPKSTYSLDTATGILTVEGTGLVWSGVPSANKLDVKEIVFADGITEICDMTYSGYYNIEKVTLPEGLKVIGNWNFYGTKLTEISLPSTLTKVGDYAFGNSVLESVEFADTRAVWNNVTIGQYNTVLDKVVCKGEIFDYPTQTTVWVYDGVDTIYLSGTGYITSFTDGNEMIPDDIAANIKHIVLDETIAGFGAYTFANMPNLVDVTGGENMRYIGNCAFKNCKELTTVEFTSAQYFGAINYGAFMYCESLESITLSEYISVIYGAAFRGCISLKEVVVPAKVETIGEYVFWNCTGLETLEIKGAKTLGAGSVQNCTALKSVVLPDTLLLVGGYAFYGANPDMEVSFNNWDICTIGVGNSVLKNAR